MKFNMYFRVTFFHQNRLLGGRTVKTESRLNAVSLAYNEFKSIHYIPLEQLQTFIGDLTEKEIEEAILESDEI